MTDTQIKEYLKKYRIDSEEQLAKHIEELKRNTKPNLTLISELVWVLADEESFINSFCANKKECKKSRYSFKNTPEQKEKIELIRDSLLNNQEYNCDLSVISDILVAGTEEELRDIVNSKNKIKRFTEDDFWAITFKTPPQEEVIKDGQQERRSAEHIDGVLKELDLLPYKKADFNNILERWIANVIGERELFNESLLVEWKNYKPNPVKEENKGMSTRHKAYSEKQVIEDWEKRDAVNDAPSEGVKETKGKLFYELDFEFIKQMAERMQSNKDNSKYELWNWKKPMTPKGLEDLKQAMWRHILAVMSGEFEDDGREFGHLEAISNNAMMINYQLKSK